MVWMESVNFLFFISELQSKLISKTKKQIPSFLSHLVSPLVQNPLINNNNLNQYSSPMTEPHKLKLSPKSTFKRRNDQNTTSSQIKKRKFTDSIQIIEEQPKLSSTKKNKTPFQKKPCHLFLFGNENQMSLISKELKFTTEKLPPYTPIIKRLRK